MRECPRALGLIWGPGPRTTGKPPRPESRLRDFISACRWHRSAARCITRTCAGVSVSTLDTRELARHAGAEAVKREGEDEDVP